MSDGTTKEDLEQQHRKAQEAEQRRLIEGYRGYREPTPAGDESAAEPDLQRDGALPIGLCAALVLQRYPNPITLRLRDLDGPKDRQDVEQALRTDLSRHIRSRKAAREEHRLDVGRVLEWAERNRYFAPDDAETWARELGQLVEEAFQQAREERKEDTGLPHGNVGMHAVKREEVLGGALAVLAHCPDECRTKEGKVQARKLASAVDRHSFTLWGDEPPLERETMEKLFRKHLNRMKKKAR